MSFWSDFTSTLGLVPRLVLAVGTAIAVGGGIQTYLLLAGGAEENSERLKRELTETLAFIAPLVADQALLGEYAAIEQLLNNQVKKAALDRFEWTDRDGRSLIAQDKPDVSTAPDWFIKLASIDSAEETVQVTSGGVGYGKLYAKVTPTKAEGRLWDQFIKQLQILAATLFLMLQFIWLIFRGNLGTLRMLAESANRFSQGDYAVRIKGEGAPEVRLAADAFNNMANNTQSLLDSLGKSESKNRLLATIVEQSTEAIWTCDLNSHVTSWNTGAKFMFGYNPEEVIGKIMPVVGVHEDRDSDSMRRLLSGERFSNDAKVQTKSGNDIDIQVALAPLLNEQNKCVGIIAVARDVTMNKRNEEALKQAREAAEMASHAKGAFLARMSHEIRTPMNGVLGMTELLLETGLTNVQRKYAETVQGSGKNLLAIINDILDFSKIEAGKLELEQVEMDIRNTLEDTVDLLAERAHAKGLELACRIPAELHTFVKGDPLRLGQVLTNLTSNAIKFTQSGSVLLTVDLVNQNELYTVLRFEVIDTGLGIPEDALAKIFDEFSQADGSTTRKFGGSGLGLAISRQLIEMMGGNIYVESQEGVGSKFWFTCRLARAHATQVHARAQTPVAVLSGVRALIAESSSIRQGLLHSQISNWGMSLQLTDAADHALVLLRAAAREGASFDLLIVDMGHPVSVAIDLVKAVRAEPQFKGTRIVFLAPVGGHDMMNDATKAGVDAALAKPVRQSDLYESLINVMSGKLPMPEFSADMKSEDAAVEAPGQMIRVLLAEDNLINQAVALGMLRLLKTYQTTVANNGREAVTLHTENPFDLILMDCHMPEMDGFEATREIRRLEHGQTRVPIIALTANAMAQDREACLEAGMDDHLSKPFSRQQIKDVLEGWQRINASASSAAIHGDMAYESIDKSVLQQLHELQTSDDPHLVQRIIELYVADSEKLLEKLALAYEKSSSADIFTVAHTLKSSSANVGAIVLSKLCQEAESVSRNNNLPAARDVIAAIRVEHSKVCQLLLNELNTISP